jgi:hypothetical protein
MAQHDVNRFRTLLDRVDPENLTDFLALNWAHLDLPSDQLDRKVNTQATHVVHDQLLDTLIKACHSSIHGNVWITGNHTSTDGSNTQKPLGRQRARRASFDTTRGAVLDHILQPYDFEASADATTCLETGNASITTSQFRNITRAGIQGWFEDATIDLGFDFLRRIFKCEDQGVILCTTAEAQNLHNVGYNASSSDAAMQDLARADNNFDNILMEKCKKAKFMIIPISDGYRIRDAGTIKGGGNDQSKLDECTDILGDPEKAQEFQYVLDIAQQESQHNNTGTSTKSRPTLRSVLYKTLGLETAKDPENSNQETTKADNVEMHGSHWAALIVDCRNPNALEGRLLDSMCSFQNPNSEVQRVAHHLLGGLHRLAIDIHLPRTQAPSLVIDSHTPSQTRDNACTRDGMSACGPFVFAIAKEFTRYIVECQEDNIAIQNINITLPATFKTDWQWDSMRTRTSLANMVKRERRVRLHLAGSHEWHDLKDRDDMVARDGYKSHLESLDLPIEWFWDPWNSTTSFWNRLW